MCDLSGAKTTLPCSKNEFHLLCLKHKKLNSLMNVSYHIYYKSMAISINNTLYLKVQNLWDMYPQICHDEVYDNLQCNRLLKTDLNLPI